MTEPERRLWWHLRQLPVETSHFRRQAPIGPYFADFVCHHHRLVIELDGHTHASAEELAADAKRTAYLNEHGYRVLRFWNTDMMKNTEGVMTRIFEALQGGQEPPTPDPSPPLRGGRGGEAHVPSLRRASMIVHTGHWDAHRAADVVVLDADERHLRRMVLSGQGGLTFLLDLPHATILRHGDGLVLDDGDIVQVAGRPEPLMEVTAGSHDALLRLAWHIGNRHTPLQVVGHALRIRCDHVLEAMLQGLGATLTPVEAPFEPEHGAYAKTGHAHGHHHDHD